MSEEKLCRLCTRVAVEINSGKLFERNQRKLLGQIEELLGQRLKNGKDLPQQICKPCEEQTLQAHTFRERCIQAQQHFATQIKKERSKKKERKLEKSPIEEIFLNDINPVKVEENEEKETGASPPPLSLIAEVMFKDEPKNSENDDDFSSDDSGECFNPLDEDQTHQNTTDEEEEQEGMEEEEDMLTIEPEIKLITDESSLHNDNEPKPEKRRKSATTKQRKNCKPKSPKERNFSCEQCGKNFKNNSLLVIHTRRHTGYKPLICEICPERFLLQAGLRRHIRLHTGEKPYPCRHCERRFLDMSERLRHERVHNNVRPYVCHQCGKAFTVGYTLVNHMLTHTDERPFGCKMCNVAFKRKTHLTTHCRSTTHKQNEEKHKSN